MDIFVYMNLVFTFGLGLLVASVIARISQTDASIAALAKEVPDPAAIEARLERTLAAKIPEALVAALDHPRFRKQIGAMVEASIVRGPFASYVKETVDEQCRSMHRYFEDEVLPRALGREAVEKVGA